MSVRSFSRIVVKLGTSTLTAGTPHLSSPRLVELVQQMAGLTAGGREVILVSSGAIATGRERLQFPQLPKDIPSKQMLAAVGQPRLMSLYEQLFSLYDLVVAQVLLTRADLSDRRRYLNSRNTLMGLLTQGVIPVVNENDTVATEEIRVGDNDNLSSYVVSLIDADLLIILTDQPGLFTADPRHDPAAKLIGEINSPDIPQSLWKAAGGSSDGIGTGGMITKLEAADLARRSGAAVVIARGGDTNIITRLVKGEKLGTWFSPLSTTMDSRKRYILACCEADGSIGVDDGAVRALHNGGSLLPVGVTKVKGYFERGDAVRVSDHSGHEIARGLVNYASDELERIKGARSEAIEATLGFAYGDEVIHRNNMVLFMETS